MNRLSVVAAATPRVQRMAGTPAHSQQPARRGRPRTSIRREDPLAHVTPLGPAFSSNDQLVRAYATRGRIWGTPPEPASSDGWNVIGRELTFSPLAYAGSYRRVQQTGAE